MMTTPNLITLLRISLIPGLVVCAAQARETPSLRWVTLGILLASLASDILDGWVARRRGQVTRLGAVLDPLADKLLFSTLFVCLALPLWPGRLLPAWVVILAISRDLYISLGILLIYMITGGVRVKPSRWGKAATAAFAALGISALAGFPEAVTKTLAWISSALIGVTWIQYTLDGMRQFVSEPSYQDRERSLRSPP